MIAEVRISGQIFRLEVADSWIKKALGLSWRNAIADDAGMTFLFKKPSRPIFWTMGMMFPIDILWVREKRVIKISENLKPGFSFCRSDEKIDAAIEIMAGKAKELGLSVGDEVFY